MNQQQLITELTNIVGNAGVLHEPEEILVYEYDASFGTHPPDVIVLPTTTPQVSQITKLAARYNLPLVVRGAGTGLSGGAIPLKGGILVVLTRMADIRSIDFRNRRAVVEAGVINLHLDTQAAAGGYVYAPDPGSGKVSTIGGNIASNAGGPHCLAYGVTANHILGLKMVLPDGEIIETGGPLADALGYDLTGVMVGSEGTLGIVTEATAQLLPQAETVRTLMIVFKTNVEDASAAVSDVIAHGIVPTAMEMMDGMVCRAVEEAVHAGYPDDAAGVLLIEVEGLADGLDETMDKIAKICREHNASEVHQAATAAERMALWTGRKSALGAMGRLAPNYYLEDGVVPRHKLPDAMAMVEEVATKYDLPIGNFFHAGDGNIHPTILFDRRDPDAKHRAHEAAVEILNACIEMGGTVSGEHGIGTEKQDFLAKLYNQNDLDAMADLKACFNPDSRLNPGKIFPKTYQPSVKFSNGATNGQSAKVTTPPSADQIAAKIEGVIGAKNLLTGDKTQPYAIGEQPPTFVAQPGSVDEVSALLRCASEAKLAVSPWDGGVQRYLGNPLTQLDLVISLERMTKVLEHYPSDLTAAVQAGCSLQAANQAFAKVKQMLPLDAPLASQNTLGGIVSAGPLAAGLRRLGYGTVRDMLLGIQMVRPDGRVVRRGGMVVKNVAGYDMAKLQYGALDTLGIITQLNLKLLPQPEDKGAILAGFADLTHTAQVVDKLMASQLQPATIAILDADLAAQLDLSNAQPYWLFVRFDGRAAAVSRQIDDTKTWMSAADAQEIVTWEAKTLDQQWPILTDFAQMGQVKANEALLRVNVMPAEVINGLSRVTVICREHALEMHTLVDAATGVIWLRVQADINHLADNLPKLQQQLLTIAPQIVIAACSPEQKQGLNVWGRPPKAAALMQRIRNRFDPLHTLNPGRYLLEV